MDSTAPLELGQLLQAPDAVAREVAWERLIAGHTRLLLAVARSFGGGHDEMMERYTYLLEKLREREFHRLRAFQSDGRARFSTWLTVAARRLCLDHYRSRYGRLRPDRHSSETLRGLRRKLQDSISAEVDTDTIADSVSPDVDLRTAHAERDESLRLALATLSDRDRLLLVLRFEDDLSAARITNLMDFPTPFHVYRRLKLVLIQLRLILAARGFENADG